MEHVVRHKLTGDRVGTSDGVIVGLSVGDRVGKNSFDGTIVCSQGLE